MADIEMEDNGDQLPFIKPITLPSRPTCLKCIAWCKGLIAVAGGEVVHIINIDQPTPQVETVRVNEFEEADIRVDIASQVNFSLGREQSNSSIVALSWSSPGLGIHRRPVLAILTSNHLLSFWEFSGKVGTWRRTAIINHVLNDNVSGESHKSESIINTFTFLPPFGSKNSRPRDQFLTVLDDRGYIWVINISKNNATSQATWETKVLLHQLFNHSNMGTERAAYDLTRGRAHPVYDVIDAGSSKCFYDEDRSMSMARIRIGFRKTGHRIHPSGILSFMLQIELENGQYTVSVREAGCQQLKHNHVTPEAFADVIADAAEPFDKEYSLDGHYAVRWRGFAESPDETMMAACITLHPSAGPEALPPRSEQSIVLFAPTEKKPVAELGKLTQSDVLLNILRSIMRLERSKQSQNTTDESIIRTAASAVLSLFTNDMRLMNWAQSISDTKGSSRPIETCEICQTGNIPFADDGISVCDTGHRFTRCSITLLSIQSPGISKYCFKCSKSFLRTEELEHQEGPSLMKSLLEEFDLCPYCQGYYRD